MDSLTNRIAALPEWPVHSDYTSRGLQRRFIGGAIECEQAIAEDSLQAALARLALAREFMKMVIADGADAEDGADCSCPWCSNARALLAALEGPK